MRLNFLLPFFAIVLLVISCFMPWITVESKNITITGVHTEGTLFGKPGYFHFVWVAPCFFFLLLNKLWAQRAAAVFSAFNMAWAVRNFFLIPVCQMGDCPVRRSGLYFLFFSSLLLFGFVLLLPVKQTAKGEQ